MVFRINNFLRPMAAPEMPLLIATKLGQVEGIKYRRKFGYNSGVSTSYEDIIAQGGTYPEVTTSETVSIVSSSGLDTSGGTGARTVNINGLDANGDEINEDIILNGATPVVSTKIYSFIHRIKVLTSGTGLTNAGNLTLTNTASAQTLGYIGAGDGITLQLVYKIPRAYYGMMLALEIGGARNDGFEVEVIAKEDGGSWNVIWEMPISENTGSFNIGVVLPPLTVFKVKAKKISGGGTGTIGASASGYLIDETFYNSEGA